MGLQIVEIPKTTSEKVENVESNETARAETSYSAFSKPEKLGIVLLVAFAAVFSPLSSYIYFPALTAIASDLHTTLSRINLTITSYMIVSGVAPTILGSLADQLGRRPIYILMFSVFVLANVGLALQTSYPALLVLRMLQSAGGSATVGLGYGVVGDITESSERGAYMGILGCGPNAAPGLGPVLGGVLAYKAGWRWTFWFLAISGALTLLLIATILPETARSVVGNGSRPTGRLHKSLLMLWQDNKKEALPGASGAIPHKGKLSIPSLLDSISILLCRDTTPIIMLNAVFYAAMNCLQASLSSLFITIYNYRELEAGLVYLPFGAGCFIATLLSCKGPLPCITARLSRLTSSKIKQRFLRTTIAVSLSVKVFPHPAKTHPKHSG